MEKCRCVKPCSELDTVVFLQGQFKKTKFFNWPNTQIRTLTMKAFLRCVMLELVCLIVSFFFYYFSKELNEQSQLVVNNSLPGLQNIITEKVEFVKKLCNNMPSYFEINLDNFSELMIKLKIIYLTLNDSHPAI